MKTGKFRFLSIAALVGLMTIAMMVGLQACGKSNGNGVGGNVSFFGAGS